MGDEWSWHLIAVAAIQRLPTCCFWCSGRTNASQKRRGAAGRQRAAAPVGPAPVLGQLTVDTSRG